jgi:hypothetical protein
MKIGVGYFQASIFVVFTSETESENHDVRRHPGASYYPEENDEGIDTLGKRVQLRSIRRQTLRMQALRGAIRQALLDDMTAMNGGTIPNEHHLAGALAPQALQRGDHAL